MYRVLTLPVNTRYSKLRIFGVTMLLNIPEVKLPSSRDYTTAIHSRLVDNLKSWYYLASESERIAGKDWYASAYLQCRKLSESLGVTTEDVATVTALLSPNTPWDKNLLYAEQVILHSQGLPLEKIGVYPANIGKALRYLKGESLESIIKLRPSKVYSFAHNLQLHAEYVTIDGHAIHAALGVFNALDKVPSQYFKPLWYQRFQSAYTDAALQIGIIPYALQAIVWVTYRNKRGV
jgi:hypothetical protein